MIRTATLALMTSLLAMAPAAVPALAQDHGDHHPADHGAMATHEGMPDGWLMRMDRSGAAPDMVDFQVMEPGWHVKTGRAGAGIFWMPRLPATGEYRVRTTYYLFNPASHAEAFGLFVGGEGLDAADQEYVYFLVRQTGEYLVKRRTGETTADIVAWTAHPAVPTAPAGEPGPTRYDLAVRVGATDVELLVNGATVHTLRRAGLDTDGAVGLRINHMLDVHVEDLVVDTDL